MDKEWREQLIELAEPDYRAFASSLIPNIDNVLGVRLPELRKIAKRLAKGDWVSEFASLRTEWFEEAMLHAMIIGYWEADLEEILKQVAAFVPKIDNWSVCDSFCSGLKMTHTHKERVWEFLQPYLESEREYEIRFAVVMLLQYYAEERYLDAVLTKLDGIRHDGYYVRMAVAWAISICFIKLPERTMAYLQSNSLDKDTYNKALRKITESYQVPPATKAIIRGMKRA